MKLKPAAGRVEKELDGSEVAEGDWARGPDLRHRVQWHPAITRCHGTEKNVRYSGVFVIAKTPL